MNSAWARACVGLCAVISGAATAPGQGLVFRGLLHTPEGGAGLVVDPNGHLIVSGIGGSGADGVRIDATESERWVGSFAPFDVAAPTGAWLRCSALGFAGGPLTQTLSVVQLQDDGADVQLRASFPFLGSPPVDVTVYNGNTPAASATGLTGVLAEFLTAAYELNPVWTDAGVANAQLRFEQPTTITITGQSPATGDRILVHVAAATAVQSVREVTLHAADTGPFTVRDEWIAKFGNPHRALGSATIAAAGACPACHLEVQAIGSSGGSGVSILVDAADSVATTWLALNASSLPNGAFLQLAARGSVNGVAGSNVGFARIVHGGATLSLLADFTAIGAFEKNVEAYRNGVLVGQVNAVTAPVVATVDASDWPTGCDAHRRLLPRAAPALVLTWPKVVLVMLVGGPAVPADELRIYAHNATGDVDSLTIYDATGGDIPEHDIQSEDADPVCPGDIDGNNQVGLADLSTLLSNFGTMGGATFEDGDLNNDGDVLIDDLSLLLSYFGVDCGVQD